LAVIAAFTLAVLAPARAEMSAAPAVAAMAAAAERPAVAPAVIVPQARRLPSVGYSCGTAAQLQRFHYRLERTGRRLARDERLTIVAIGSSSTAGTGASSPAASYPGRLAAEFKARLPGRDIVVVNRGVGGQTTEKMLARFSSDVIAARPDLVLWQVGTNSVLRDRPLPPHAQLLRDGIARLKAAGADVVLIDMQFAPRVAAKPEAQAMEDQIALAAKEQSVDLFPRFALMRGWHEVQHIPFEVFVSPDRLHMNDWSYACLAKLLAADIIEAATRPVAAAAAARRH